MIGTGTPVIVPLVQRSFETELRLPPGAVILKGRQPERLRDPEASIREALARPLGSRALEQIARAKLSSKPDASAVVVVSDSTRPVPYKGPEGILWPVVQCLLSAGFSPLRIVVLVATGTHHIMNDDEIRDMIDDRVTRAGVAFACHDARGPHLTSMGQSRGGVDIRMNRRYVQLGS